MDKEGPEKGPDTTGWPRWFLELLAYLEERAASVEGTEPRPTAAVCTEVDRAARELDRPERVSGRAALPPGSRARGAALPARRKGRPS
jgi:hypothetical protein